jgi:hypothetical protein
MDKKNNTNPDKVKEMREENRRLAEELRKAKLADQIDEIEKEKEECKRNIEEHQKQQEQLRRNIRKNREK